MGWYSSGASPCGPSGWTCWPLTKRVGAESGRAEFHRGAVRDGKLDEQSKRPVMGSELDVEAEPGVAARGGCRSRGRGKRRGGALCRCNRVFVGNFANGRKGIANGPGGVIEGRRRGGEVGRDADAPVLVEGERRADGGGVEDGRGGGWGGELVLGVAMGLGRSRGRGWIWRRRGGLGGKERSPTDGDPDCCRILSRKTPP